MWLESGALWVGGADSWQPESSCVSTCPDARRGTPREQAACSERHAIAINAATLTIARTIELKPMCSSHTHLLNLDSTAWKRLPPGQQSCLGFSKNVYCWP